MFQSDDPMVACLKEHNSTDKAAVDFVQCILTNAKKIGVSSPTDLKRLIRLTRLYGVDFQNDPRIPPNMRLPTDSNVTERMYAILDLRELFELVLLGPDRQGGLDRSYLESTGKLGEFM